MGETISAWIRASGINPIVLGWLVSLAILALINNWRGK